ncbi:Calcium-transporting ATPase 2, partial [Madurella mycetomatis]
REDAPRTTVAEPGRRAGFRLDLDDAFTPDPGTEDMYIAPDNKFAFSPGHLSKLLNPKSHDAFYALGGLAGLEKGLRTNRDSGLSVDETNLDGAVAFEDVAPKGTPKYGANGNTEPVVREGNLAALPPPTSYPARTPFGDRKCIFRENRLPEKKSKTLLELAWIAYNKILLLLTGAALISLALGLYQTFGVQYEDSTAKIEWVEAMAIIVAILIVVIVGALNDGQIERRFNRLSKKRYDRHVKVVRSGKSVEVSVFDVMVGDVIHLDTGDLVPVDGIFISGHGIKCDESCATGESGLVKKAPADEVFAVLQDIADGGAPPEKIYELDPFIISGSKVHEGTGKFLATAVGVNSSFGRIMMSIRTEQEDTPLQKKLNNLADWMAKLGGSLALILFPILLVKFCAQLSNNNDSPAEKGQSFLRILITSITVVVVVAPEGLSLAVTRALSVATNRMIKDNNLVRVLKACETMGNATTICSDKTGFLTQNKMTVVATTLGKSISFGGADAALEEPDEKPMVANTVPSVSVAEFSKSLGAGIKQLLIQSNAVNSTAFEVEVDGKKSFIGSQTEVALLTLCRDYLGAAPVQEARSNTNVVQVVPFDSVVKYMATIVKLPNGKFRAYIKGASEILLAKCNTVISSPEAEEFSTTELTEQDREILLESITSYAGQTLRTIGSSYRDFESWPPKELGGVKELTAKEFNKVHNDMTLVAIFGIKDPVRPAVKDALKDCHRAGVFVRMVTGDNILTGKTIAKECGIYTSENGGMAMEGPEFRRLAEDELKEVLPKLQVLARSSPEDKQILVRTLKGLSETVAVGTNDEPALKMADIGFATGIAGTEVAKEAAAIILIDNSFASIVKGIAWGRAVNDAVKKFLQFQLTVNITAVIIIFVSSVASEKEESVLNAVQLLWVNLIIDTFAALALATDPPTHSILDRKPNCRSAPLITMRMYKMIFGQAICQLAITLVLNFGGPKLLGYSGTDDKSLKTLIFNAFVWLQIFNGINNRRLDNKLNIFEGITENWLFMAINCVMVGGQVLIIFVGGDAFQITRLNGKEWGMSIGLGAISVPWGVLIRLFPDKWVVACIRNIHIRLPWKKKKAPKEANIENGTVEGPETASTLTIEEEFNPGPPRIFALIRSKRARKHIRRGFREYMHDQKSR